MRTQTLTFHARFLMMLITWSCFCAVDGMAQIHDPIRSERLEQTTARDVRAKVEPLIRKYCGEACQIISIKPEIKEEVTEISDLGFEGVIETAAAPKLFVDRLQLDVQVDDRVTESNQERLKAILLNHMRGLATQPEVVWVRVSLPTIRRITGSAEALKRKIEKRIERVVNQTFNTYCPNACLLASIDVAGTMISQVDADDLPRTQQVRDDSGLSVMRVDDIVVEVSMDQSLEEATRQKIANVLTAKTRFVTPLAVNVSVSDFPETYENKRRRQNGELDDPYGLEKLRRMLVMFRDLASTKEIIKSETNRDSSRLTSNSNSSSSNRDSRKLTDSRSTFGQEGEWSLWDYGLIGFIAIILLAIGGYAIARAKANNDAQLMIDSAGLSAKPEGEQKFDENGMPIVVGTGANSELVVREELALKMKVEGLKDEMINSLLSAPRIAKETFSRLLKEEGVEKTSKYLFIFGHMIIIELVDDQNLSRDLYALSEYYLKSHISLELSEQLDLLQELKTRFTAAEIRLMSRRGSDKFDFLAKLDPGQIYGLISDEKMQVQSIVLSQLGRKKRMSVFDLYQGRARIDLMATLAKAEAVPREFLANVAKAMHRKVQARPEFDTQNIRSSDIILDLLERSQLNEQRQIMGNLQASNPDTARALMMRLVTVEILPYLKDGHLLELVLGMEREDLVTFLGGTRDHVRDLLLGKAPRELAESWIEDLQMVHSIDPNNYRIVELKIFARIRALSDSGTISLLDINTLVFAPENRVGGDDADVQNTLSPDSMVA